MRTDLKMWRRKHPARTLLQAAKHRAKKNSIPFNLEEGDIQVPTFCPILGIEISVSPWNGQNAHRHRHDGSPSLDRIIPSLGYIKGNVRVISWRANRLKADANLQELEKLVDYLRIFG